MSLAAILSLVKGAATYWQYVAIGLLVAALGTQTLRLAWTQNELTGDRLAQAEAVRAAQERADALSNELVIEQAKAMAQLDKTLQPIKERIVRVPSTTVCRDSPAIRAAIDGVRGALGAGGAQTR